MYWWRVIWTEKYTNALNEELIWSAEDEIRKQIANLKGMAECNIILKLIERWIDNGN